MVVGTASAMAAMMAIALAVYSVAKMAIFSADYWVGH